MDWPEFPASLICAPGCTRMPWETRTLPVRKRASRIALATFEDNMIAFKKRGVGFGHLHVGQAVVSAKDLTIAGR